MADGISRQVRRRLVAHGVAERADVQRRVDAVIGEDGLGGAVAYAEQGVVRDRGDLGGIRHLVPDFLSGRVRKDKEMFSLDQVSRISDSEGLTSEGLPPTWWRRTDPYWGAAFATFTPWFDWEKVAGLRVSGLDEERVGVLAEKVKEGSHFSLLWDDMKVQRVFSLLHLMGCASTGNLLAMAEVSEDVLDEMFVSNLLECAWFHRRDMPWPRERVWRLRRGFEQADMAAELCVDPDGDVAKRCFLGLNPLSPIRTTANTARHQVTSMELVLRALEASDQWAGWLPEGACASNRFVPPDHPQRSVFSTPIWADACLVRNDGGRVFIESQLSALTTASRKVARWSELFDNGFFGGCVLFIAASQPANIYAVAESIRQSIVEFGSDRSLPYMLVGSWLDYSPDANQITEGAVRLPAVRFDGGKWVDCDALSVEVECKDYALLGELSGLFTSPSWAENAMPDDGNEGD